MESCRVLWVLCSLCSRASSRGRWRWDWRRSAHSAAGVGGAEKVVVVHKTSRLDFVKMNQPDKTEHDIARILRDSGVDYDYLRERHSIHTQSLDEIHSYLDSRGCSVRLRNRETFSEDDAVWADLLIAAGGDGNFLFTASKVNSLDKLVVGLNTDPYKSEGFLCLQTGLTHPQSVSSQRQSGLSCSKTGSSGYLTDQLSGVFSGRYREMRRQRIRVTLESQTLPVRALNEVFVGEKDISHSSYYEFSHDGGPSERQKSSGLLVYTGSGSTSWAYNMNRISSEEVQKLFKIAGETTSLPVELSQPQLAQHVSEMFNSSNAFGGEEQSMAFTVREPIIRGIFAVGKTHGFAKTVKVVSRSWNANLVLDGHYCTDFPNGSTALLELHDTDCLRTLTSSSSSSSSTDPPDSLQQPPPPPSSS